ncbi:hypothetical protein LIER_39608 [Lithospermum erythrorhizon]|uniref:Ubiquinone biosynthesis protein n=1 Tax=Lithospermum erythrorhizon TaxID=34254 RepID=A0AAV3QHE0_LITER
MYRSAAKQCFTAAIRRRSSGVALHTTRSLAAINWRRFSSSTSANSDGFLNRNPNGFESSSKTYAEEEQAQKKASPTGHYEQEQASVLHAALHHVIRLGWTEAAMIAGARDVGVSPSIVGAFPRKDAALVEFFMDDCLQRLIDIIDSEESLRSLTPSQRVGKLVRIRLEMQAPYISKWAQALSIQAHPLNVPSSFKQRAMLMDEIWHAVGDDGTDVDWYVRRTILGGVYSATELYMLTDTSLGFCDTWAFLDGRIRDVFDLKKTAQEIHGLGAHKFIHGAGEIFRRSCYSRNGKPSSGGFQ